METEFFSLVLSLFILMDPLGNVAVFVSILKRYPPEKQRFILARELLIALFVIIVFSSFGNGFLKILGVDASTISISGGIILFIISLNMIFKFTKNADGSSDTSDEPLIVPLAIPLVAGPSVLAAVMIYSKDCESLWFLWGAIGLAWLLSSAILFSSELLKKLLKTRGLLACEKLMGLILTLISVEMFLDGIRTFFNRCI